MRCGGGGGGGHKRLLGNASSRYDAQTGGVYAKLLSGTSLKATVSGGVTIVDGGNHGDSDGERQLVRDYAATRSQAAFAALVDRYVNVVYAAARRQVRDADLARDVTQAVFLVLADKAGELDARRPLSGWLLQVTRYASANAIRARARRARHEKQAGEMHAMQNMPGDDSEWRDLAPLLDEGMSRLRGKDRDVLLLRFFERKTAREVGQSLGISEDAAEKRITRAVGKLRDFFQRRGVTVSVVALATTLAANCAEAAPIGLTASITAASAASAATSSASAFTATSIAKGTVLAMASAKTKTALVAACALLVLGGGTVAVTSIVRSPKHRRVVVAPPAGVANVMTGATSQQLTFSQGTTIDLLYISDDPKNPSRWWSPDGTPVAAPTPPLTGIDRISLGGDGPQHLLVLRQSDPRGSNASMTVMIGRANVGGAASSEESSRDGARLHSYLFNTRGDAPAVVDVRVGLASGEWSDVQEFPLEALDANVAATSPAITPGTSPATAPAPVLTIADVREQGRMTEVTFRFTPGSPRFQMPLDERIVLVGTDGREHFVRSWSASTFGGNVLSFAIPRTQARALTYRSRPYEQREIRNVSLRPGVKTAVAVAPSRAR
jgi:RNA polymerase sigma factor (sigma-70 family)